MFYQARRGLIAGRGALDASASSTPFTWNPADSAASLTFGNSNRDLTGNTDAGHDSVRTTQGFTSGLRYCEFKIQSTLAAQPPLMLGIMNTTATLDFSFIGSSPKGGCYGWFYQTSFADTFTVANAIPGTQNLATNDIVGMALNLSNGKVWISLNNTWLVGDPGTDSTPWLTFTVGSDTWYFAATLNLNVGTPTVRLDSSLVYTAPTGFTGVNA